MKQGMCYWITGLAGVGKTTIGNSLYYKLKEQQDNVVILDGDILKKCVGNVGGYSYDERKQRARVYSNLCQMLVEQGIIVVICTIAMFDEIREWNRDNINNYIEVFVKASEEVLFERNKKNLYCNGGKQTVGYGVECELPKSPDIVINNDGIETIDDIVKKIQKVRSSKKISVVDTEYWNEYYNRKILTEESSEFAKYVVNYITNNDLKLGKIVDLGCGNGRDSSYFALKGFDVLGIDLSQSAIDILKRKSIGNTRFVCGDFCTSRNLFQEQFEYAYSRWTLHAINEKQEDNFIRNMEDCIKENGYWFIEARTVNDEIYGLGEKIGENQYIYENHYRRFIDIEEFRKKIDKHPMFEVVSIIESNGFSKTNSSDPVLMRCILKKTIHSE